MNRQGSNVTQWLPQNLRVQCRPPETVSNNHRSCFYYTARFTQYGQNISFHLCLRCDAYKRWKYGSSDLAHSQHSSHRSLRHLAAYTIQDACTWIFRLFRSCPLKVRPQSPNTKRYEIVLLPFQSMFQRWITNPGKFCYYFVFLPSHGVCEAQSGHVRASAVIHIAISFLKRRGCSFIS